MSCLREGSDENKKEEKTADYQNNTRMVNISRTSKKSKGMSSLNLLSMVNLLEARENVAYYFGERKKKRETVPGKVSEITLTK